MADYALITNDTIMNVIVIEDGDTDTVAHFETLYDEVIDVAQIAVTGNPPEGAHPWIGWFRVDKGKGKPFPYFTPPVLVNVTTTTPLGVPIVINVVQGILQRTPSAIITSVEVSPPSLGGTCVVGLHGEFTYTPAAKGFETFTVTMTDILDRTAASDFQVTVT